MKFKAMATAAAIATASLGTLLASPAAQAQAQEQCMPLLVYRTGQFAPQRHELLLRLRLGGGAGQQGA